MQESWTEKYYSLAARATLEDRRKEWTPELQAEAEKAWRELFADVEAALDEDPAVERAQALAARWRKLVAGFTQGDREVSDGLKKLRQDQANWPAFMPRGVGLREVARKISLDPDTVSDRRMNL